MKEVYTMNKIIRKIQYLKVCSEDHRNYYRVRALSVKKKKILNEIESGIRPKTDMLLYKHYDAAQNRILEEMDQFLRDWSLSSKF